MKRYIVKTIPLFSLCFLLFFLPAAFSAVKELVIEKGAIRKASVAVPDFTKDGMLTSSKLAAELSETLRFDLDNSGFYNVIKKKNFVANAQRNDLNKGSIILAEWRALEAELLFKSAYSVDGNELKISCNVYDVLSGKKVFHKTLAGSAENPRRVVHFMTNAIIKKLTGAEGIATTRILFVADVGNPNVKNLYLIDYDGHNLQPITRDKPSSKVKAIAVTPDWSPDGKKTYYTSFHHGYPYVYVIDFERGMREIVSKFPGLNTSPAISPDGKEMVLALSKSGTVDLYRMDIEGKDPKRLTHSYGGVSTCPSWSPDGKRIAFVSNREGAPQIYVMNADGSNIRRLIRGYRYTTSVDWSPKEDVIAFSAKQGRYIQIFAADLVSKKAWQITFDDANHQHPSFAPDGIHIVYVREENYNADLYIVDIRDPKPVQITSFKGNEQYPAWSPVSF